MIHLNEQINGLYLELLEPFTINSTYRQFTLFHCLRVHTQSDVMLQVEGRPWLAVVRGAGRNYEQVPAVVTSVAAHLGHWSPSHWSPRHAAASPHTAASHLVTVTSLASTRLCYTQLRVTLMVMMEPPPAAGSSDS